MYRKMEEQPVKQFYNKKTKKWHVYFRNPETGDVRIKQVNDRKMPDVKVIGKHRPDGIEVSEQLYTEPEQKIEPENEPKTEQPEEPKEESKNENSSNGFFDFL